MILRIKYSSGHRQFYKVNYGSFNMSGVAGSGNPIESAHLLAIEDIVAERGKHLRREITRLYNETRADNSTSISAFSYMSTGLRVRRELDKRYGPVRRPQNEGQSQPRSLDRDPRWLKYIGATSRRA